VEKKKSNVVYTVTFDAESGLPTEILESVIAIARPDPTTKSKQEEYYIFSTRYTLSGYGAEQRMDVPGPAQPLLR
jgi:hypothetical protein